MSEITTNSKKICFFTGSRAEYGLMRALMKAVQKDPKLELQLIVSGSHLEQNFGNTVQEIEKDGIPISQRLAIETLGDTPQATCAAMAKVIANMGQTLEKFKPDMLIVLGDRFETFAAAAAATVSQVYLVHIHGGELTLGAYDDALRHGITKMSQLHLAATEEYRNRIIQMGEKPETVFNVGSPGVEATKNIQVMSRTELERELDFSLAQPSVIVTYHPETRDTLEPVTVMKDIIKVLDGIDKLRIIFTAANGDAGGREINEVIKEYTNEHPEKSLYVPSLGQHRYFSVLRLVDAMVGNSSSGIIEAASFGLPVVNIGERQKGRVRTKNIIDSPANSKAVQEACERALSADFRQCSGCVTNPYEKENTTFLIMEILQHVDTNITTKDFYDLPSLSFNRVRNEKAK
ncbi:MAG: UDP-N-acetylglucosamine 2-epimerase [Desulfobulbaceae bacterium]|nr:UDP-N-acetylglucosamine 2-epimerase [Desulfobulbaceae bacterium]